jgi:Flagellar transcriptional activator (FlhC)
MRISDDRYSRDRLRLDLALRFIHHEARTHTIRAWTGLTDDRIRKLYRTYLHEADGSGVPRHRGKSPRQAAFFTRSLRMRREAAVFASVSSLFGLITPQTIVVDRGALPAPTVARGALLCEAFEVYRALVNEPQISFEHAVYLLSALLCGDELRVAHCRDCSAVLVTDRLALRTPVCNDCAAVKSAPGAADTDHPTAR